MANDSANRRHKRIKMVLPLRIWAKDSSDHPFHELAHTLDITPRGAKLGAIHRPLKPGDKIVVQYRQRKIAFRVVWSKPLEGTNEFQVGIEALEAGETWGLELGDSNIDERQSKHLSSQHS
jgi:hypothetical protein